MWQYDFGMHYGLILYGTVRSWYLPLPVRLHHLGIHHFQYVSPTAVHLLAGAIGVTPIQLVCVLWPMHICCTAIEGLLSLMVPDNFKDCELWEGGGVMRLMGVVRIETP